MKSTEKRNQLRTFLKIQIETKPIKTMLKHPNRKEINSEHFETIQIDRYYAFFKRGIWLAKGAPMMPQYPNRNQIN